MKCNTLIQSIWLITMLNVIERGIPIIQLYPWGLFLNTGEKSFWHYKAIIALHPFNCFQQWYPWYLYILCFSIDMGSQLQLLSYYIFPEIGCCIFMFLFNSKMLQYKSWFFFSDKANVKYTFIVFVFFTK